VSAGYRLGAGQPLGEGALRFSLPAGADPPTLLATLRAVPGVVDAIVTDAWVAVTFDVTSCRGPPLLTGELRAAPLPPPRVHDIPVRYDGADLDEVARATDLTPFEVARLHAAGSYRVLFVGFAPGFGYLGGLDPRLRCPRRASPRPHVPAGAVAIADDYTAVYPSASPGGWNLLGTALVLPSGLLPGDEVSFRAA
jgi:5-oxoprolinase (ATP-hydrolysing) subunit A